MRSIVICYTRSVVGVSMCLSLYLSVCLLVTTVSPTKRLNRSCCRCGYGLRWAQETMCYMGSEFPQGKRQFWGHLWPAVKYRAYLTLAKVIR